jgi:VWFA-related protein
MKKRSSLALLLAAHLVVLNLHPTLAQNPQAPQEDGDVVRITTNLVQIDVTATDKDGRQVTDLRPEEFEVFENGRKQEITNFSYIAFDPTSTAPSGKAANSIDKMTAPIPPVRLRPEQVRRTFALFVDDFRMTAESMHFVRGALKKFVDEQMQPGDLVTIIRASTGALQQFTTDKRQLHAAIKRIRWNPGFGMGELPFSLTGNGLSPSAGNEEPSVTDPADDGLSPGSSNDRNPLGDPMGNAEDYLRELSKFRTMNALNFVTRGIKDLPGRKAVIVMTDGFEVSNETGTKGRLLGLLDHLIELANRASVVFYTIDARGLQPLNFTAADKLTSMTGSGGLLREARTTFFDSQTGLRYLAEQTGGTFMGSNNDLGGGIKRAIEDQKGYYLVAYRPEPSTFDPASGRQRFHKLSVKVKRPGVQARTRSGFVGVSSGEVRNIAKVAPTRREQLISAINSPFSGGEIDLRLTSLFANEARTGSFMRSLIRVDAGDLKFTEEANGWLQAVLDVMAVTVDAGGKVSVEVNQTQTVRVKAKAYERLLRDGLVYMLNVPVKRPGGYQLRIALREAATNRTGSAGQFVEALDLNDKRLALSGIVLTGSGRADAPGNAGASSMLPKGAGTGGTITEGDIESGPAVRRLRQGMIMDFGYFIYNARPDKQTQRPQLQTQMRLFRDGQLVFTGKLTPYDASNQADPRRLTAGGRLLLPAELQPGDYVLQVVVRDTLEQNKPRMATQWIDFEIVQ